MAVLVSRKSAGKRPGLTLHRTRSLHAEDRAVQDGIPVTSVARTLLELGCDLDHAAHARVYEEATRLGLLDLTAISRLLERSAGRRAAKRLASLVAEDLWVPEDAREGLELRFASFCRSRRIALPAFNALVEGYVVDALWPAQKLIAELDSRTHHATWQARERDSERDIDLQENGYRVIRIVTWRRLHRDGTRLEASIRKLLAAPTPERPPAPRRGAA
jgi:very-short-patch-repair endonuclease